MSRLIYRSMPLIATALAIVALLVYQNPYFDGVIAGSLLFLLPGWAVVAWARQFRASWDLTQRAFWTVLLSLGVVVISGLVLNLVSDLSRKSWLIWELGLAIVLTVLNFLVPSWSRRLPPSDNVKDESEDSEAMSERGPRITLVNVVLVGVSACMLVGAVWISEISSSRDSRERIVQLYMVPVPALQGSYATKSKMGVENLTGGSVTLQVRLYHRNRRTAVRTWTLHLKDRGQWSQALKRSDSTPLFATVAYSAHPDKLISSVSLGSPHNA